MNACSSPLRECSERVLCASSTHSGQLDLDIERLSDLELDEMQTTYEKIKTSWTERQKRAPRASQEK